MVNLLYNFRPRKGKGEPCQQQTSHFTLAQRTISPLQPSIHEQGTKEKTTKTATLSLDDCKSACPFPPWDISAPIPLPPDDEIKNKKNEGKEYLERTTKKKPDNLPTASMYIIEMRNNERIMPFCRSLYNLYQTYLSLLSLSWPLLCEICDLVCPNLHPFISRV